MFPSVSSNNNRSARSQLGFLTRPIHKAYAFLRQDASTFLRMPACPPKGYGVSEFIKQVLKKQILTDMASKHLMLARQRHSGRGLVSLLVLIAFTGAEGQQFHYQLLPDSSSTARNTGVSQPLNGSFTWASHLPSLYRRQRHLRHYFFGFCEFNVFTYHGKRIAAR